LTTEQAKSVLKDLEHRKFVIEQVDLLKKDTSDYRMMIRLKDNEIHYLDVMNKNLSVELESTYNYSEKYELDLAKQKSRHRKTTSTLLIVSGVLLAIVLIK